MHIRSAILDAKHNAIYFATDSRPGQVIKVGINGAAPKASPASAAQMEQFMRYYADDSLFSGTVLVARNGQAIFHKAYGLANREWNIPNTTDSRIRIGSLSKQFTAAAILLLEQQGKLRVEDHLKRYIPAIPAAWDPITIHQLLNHTSGITTYTLRQRSWPFYRPMSALELIDFLRDHPLDFPPGSSYRYSNSGYFLLGALIEKVSGKTYAEFLQDNFFTPLEMAHTGVDDWSGDHPSVLVPHRASGYIGGGLGEYKNAAFVDMSVPGAAGSLYTTPSDLGRWEEALYGGQVIAPVELAKMTTPSSPMESAAEEAAQVNAENPHYGYGIQILSWKGHKQYFHTGGIDGFAAAMAYYPDEKIAVIVLTNGGSRHMDVFRGLTSLAYREQVPLPKAVPVAPAILKSYVGDYGQPGKPTLKITLLNGRLVARRGQGNPAYLLSESDTKFFNKISKAELIFTRKDGGPAAQVSEIIEAKEARYSRLPAAAESKAAAGLAGKWTTTLLWEGARPRAYFVFTDVTLDTFSGTMYGAETPNKTLKLSDGRILNNRVSFTVRKKPKDGGQAGGDGEVVARYTGTLQGDQLILYYENVEKWKSGRTPDRLLLPCTRVDAPAEGASE